MKEFLEKHGFKTFADNLNFVRGDLRIELRADTIMIYKYKNNVLVKTWHISKYDSSDKIRQQILKVIG
jgi:hypothetical protein